MSDEVLWGKHTWIEIDRLRREEKTVVLLPVGSTEQHGPHLPLDNDWYTAYMLSIEAAKYLSSNGIRALVLPPITYGMSLHWMENPGTVSLRHETLFHLVYDVLNSVWRHGFKKLVVINGHGGNTHIINAAVDKLVEDLKDPDLRILVVDWWRMVSEKAEEVLETPIFHADEGETSVAMALGQRVVLEELEKVKPGRVPLNPKWRGLGSKAAKLRDYGYRPGPVDPGAYGDPAKATPEKGHILVEEFKSLMLEAVRELLL